jgi:hypothetical protein
MEGPKWFMVDITLDRGEPESAVTAQYVLDIEELAAVESYLKAIEEEDAVPEFVVFAYAQQGVSGVPGTMLFLPEVMTLGRASPLHDFTPPLEYEMVKANALIKRTPEPILPLT